MEAGWGWGRTLAMVLLILVCTGAVLGALGWFVDMLGGQG